jgi:uncharacterized membrane protein
MSDPIPDAVKSTASIAGHPIHPMLVPLPIGFLVGALLSDLGYTSTTDPFWAEASRWLLLGGIVTGVLAALFGLIDFLTISYVRSRTAAWIHFLGNATAIVLSLINLLSRPSGPQANVPNGGLILSLVVVLIFLVTGWLGGELSYRYRIGVIPRVEAAGERTR